MATTEGVAEGRAWRRRTIRSAALVQEGMNQDCGGGNGEDEANVRYIQEVELKGYDEWREKDWATG